MLTSVLVTINMCRCNLCGWEWRSEEVPSRCAKCKTTAWNKEPEEISEKDEVEIRATIERVNEEAAKPKKKVKTIKRQLSAKDVARCRHNFMVLPDGTTQCPQCKIGA